MAPVRPPLDEVQLRRVNNKEDIPAEPKVFTKEEAWSTQDVQVLVHEEDDSTVATSTPTTPTRVTSPFSSNATSLSSQHQPSNGPRRRKIAFLAHGTLGDYLPAALVAGQLSRRGYTTIFMAPANVKYLVKGDPDVRFVDFGISMQDAREHTPEGQLLNNLHFHSHRRRVVDWVGVMLKDWTPRLIRFLEEEKPDLVVTTVGTLTFLSPIIEAYNVPTISLLANPMHMTGEHLPTCGPQVMRTTFIPAFNKFWWWYMFNNITSIAKVNLMKRVLPECRDLDPSLFDRLRKLKLKQCRYMDFPKLILCSRSFYPTPKDWDPRSARVVGVTWPPDEIRGFERKAEVEAFLSSHPDNVAYVGFGSMLAVYRENKHRLRVLRAAVSSCVAAGLAVIVSTSGAKGFETDQPDKVLVLGDELVPHGWLFPRCRIIVHHGGSGTTHMALRAGRPQVVVPFQFPTWYYNGVEQGFWARQIKHAGVGGGIFHVNLAYKFNIFPLVKRALRPEMARNAEEVAKRIRSEDDGLPIATAILDRVLQDDPRTNGVDLSKY